MMTDTGLTSKELLIRTGISRATLNNYVALGILPRPDVKVPAEGDGRARRLGYFPLSVVDTVNRVRELKREGMAMNEIAALVSGEAGSGHKDVGSDTSDAKNNSDEGDIDMPAHKSGKMPFLTPIEGNTSSENSPLLSTASIPSDEAGPSSHRQSSKSCTPVMQPFQGLSIDSVSDPAYLVNNRFEVEWSNETAQAKMFGLVDSLPKEIGECNVFPLLMNWETISRAADRDEIIRFHLSAAKKRLPRSLLYSLGSLMDGEHVEMLLDAYDVVEPADRAMLLQTTVNLAPEGEQDDWYILYASFFREGVFFSYTPSYSPCGNLIELLGRRDVVIRELLKRRRPYLTDLAVLVADIQNSVKICAELPPEEYFELINQVWSTMDPILRKYHATHGKHVGDGLLCYFFPQPDSDYILNSIQCALEMQEAMRHINQEWRNRKNWANILMLNIGLDEGQEWFGTYQTNTHLEFTVLGDTVNRGGRLSDFSRGGSVWGTKNLIGKLVQRDRDKVHYGINRYNADGESIFVKTTFSRISNLVDLDLSENQKHQDLGALPVTEIVSVS